MTLFAGVFFPVEMMPLVPRLLVLVDAAQGIEAQTLANLYLALENDLHVIAATHRGGSPRRRAGAARAPARPATAPVAARSARAPRRRTPVQVRGDGAPVSAVPG